MLWWGEEGLGSLVIINCNISGNVIILLAGTGVHCVAMVLCVCMVHILCCIYRALEDKKEAFAKAEIERRKEALELRRKGQQEATLRFRNVIRKPPIKPPERKQ